MFCVSDSLCLNVDEIVAVEKASDLLSITIKSGKTFEVRYPTTDERDKAFERILFARSNFA